MAKQVEDIVVRLVGEGFEALDKIKGSFRELGKVTNLAEKDILSARDSLLDFAKKAGNTEAVNKGLIEAFKGLRSQTQLCGDAYGELTAELTRLEAVQRGSTAATDRQREALLRNAAAGKQNAAAIEQQIQGLTRLQQQTRPGSSAFLQLGKDIDAARVNLGRFRSEAAAFSSTLTQIPGASLDTLGRQIGRLTQGMQTLKIASDEYLNTQQRISLLGEVRGRTTGRQRVRAANLMYESPQFQSFAASRAGNLELPSTLAGIQQRVGEINAELQNVSGYTRRRSLTIELANLNRQLKSSIVDVVTQENLAVDAVIRRVNASREINQASGFGAFSSQVAGGEFDPAITTSIRRARERLERENDRLRAAAAEAIQISRTPLLPAAGQTSAPGTGELISGGARRLRGQVETTLGAGVDDAGNTPRAPWQQNYLPNAAVGTAPSVGFAAGAAQAFDNLGRSTDRARRPLRDIFAELERVRGASNGSVNSLQAQISAWTQIRSAVSSSAPVFATATKQIEALSRQQARLQVGGGRRLTGSQLAQGAGAALSGGIFGGPEGLIGGLGGLAFGGVGGAFAGAAAGAQVGMFRQQLGGTAEYAASIGKLQIALRGVVGSQEAYDAAIRAAAAATRDLNIPQEEATRGLTRLSAAVIGAGGTVADSSFAFRAMSEAIKATGGNAEQVDGALLALTQVFSKGKVSAEELNQIAERLPGTFTLFAKAAGKTGPELQKALEQGEVGLNDLMKFLALTGERYGATALEIAGSSQDAGARLTVAFQAMRLEVGNALQPLGAELQETFTAFIKDITPAVVGSAKAIAAALSFFTNNEAAGGLSRFALQMGAVALALKGLQAAASGLTALNIASWFTGAATGVKITGDYAAAATPKVAGFRGALTGLFGVLKSLAAIGLITVTVDILIKNFTQLMAAKAELDRLKKERNPVGDTGPTPVMTAERRFTGASRETVTAAINIQKDIAARLRKELIPLEQVAKAMGLPTLFAQLTRSQIALKKEQIKNAEDIANLDPSAFKPQAQIDRERAAAATNFPDPTGGDDPTKAADKARRDAEAAAAEQQRLNEANAQAQIRLSEAVFRAQTDFDRKRFDLQQELISRERDLRIAALTGVAAETASQTAQFFRTVDELRQRATQAAVDTTASQRALQNATFMRSVTAAPAATAGASGGAPRIGGFTPQQLSSATTAASKFTGIANMCSESVKAFYKSLGITLPGVTEWADTVRKSGQVMTDWSKLQAGDIVATGRPGDTPHVGVYTGGNNVFHQSRSRGLTAGNYPDLDYFRSGYFVRPTAAAGRQATGVASQQRRNAADQGDVAIAQVDFDMAVKYKDLLEDMVQKRLPQEVQLYALEGAKAYNAQSQALRDNVAELEKRQMLEMSSTRQELVDGELQKFQLTRNYTREIAQLNEDLKQKEVLEDPTGAKAAGINARIAATTQAYADQKIAIDELTAAQIKFNDAKRFGQDERIGLGMQEGVNSYIESIGTMRQATEELTVNGIKGVENAIFDLVTTGKTNFREFAADILRQTARMIIQQLVLRNVMLIVKSAFGFADGGAFGAGGNAAAALGSNPNVAAYAMGGTFAKNNIIPYAKGGTFTNSVVSKPTLFKFAAGGTMQTGLMGEAGPEAIMPLSRGANGKLGVSSSGGGTTNVTVNVDASGSKAQGDSGKGEQLGRAVSQAVQDELLKQRRPGGLLA